jgi:hypothetical protein
VPKPRAYISPDLQNLRRLAITAIFSDDFLLETLALKGGNALSLVHRISTRVSLDLDFSIENDFKDINDVKRRIFSSIERRFALANLAVIDLGFKENPKNTRGKRWGGYVVEFKVVTKEVATRSTRQEDLRKGALPIGREPKSIRIEISKFEFCGACESVTFDDFTIRVYSVALIVIEKLRAICQQMPAYPLRVHPAPRAKDFFDIYSSVESRNLDLATEHCGDLAKSVFAAKDVPLDLLLDIASQADFHRSDWASVMRTVTPPPENGFQFYFDYVTTLATRLHAVWVK